MFFSNFFLSKNTKAFVNFTDEEGYGRYLDLNELFQKFVNLKGVEVNHQYILVIFIHSTKQFVFIFLKKISYLKYLSEYDRLFKIPKDKKNQDYLRYVESLGDYLYNYTTRVKPLFDIDAELENVNADFEKKWSEGTFPGWPVSRLRRVFQIIIYLI